MQPAVPARRLVQFGVFELDLDTAELRKQGVKVKLQDQPCKVLQILLEKPGQIVTRDELRTRVWPANTFVEFDQGLYSAMARLREALGDSSDNPRFIETLARRGYRFIAPVNPSAPATENPPLPHPDLRFEPSTSQPNPSIRRFLISILAGLLGGALVLALILGFNIGGARQWLLRHSNRPIRSIAVLPLENLSGDPAQDYFADGMTDELITNLAELGSLRVISRTSSMQYKGVRKALRQIGNELGVDAVLEGSVSRSGQHVRITAQLIDAASDQHLWARTYDRDLGDVLIMQNEMADAIAGEVRAKLATAQPRPGKLSRVDPEEQDLYLRARYHLDKGSETEIKKGIEYFRQAIGRNPQDARNFAGLAVSYLALADYYLSPADTLFQAKQAAVKALQLDENLAETHVSLGAIDFLYDWDWQQADREFAQAVKLNPNSSDAHLWRGEFLAQMGRPDEGIAEMKLAESIDPLSLAVHVNAGWVYYVAKQEEQALEEWRKILDIDPHFTITHTAIWITYIKRAEMGSTLSERSAQTEEDTLNMAAVIGRYAVSGNRAEAERLLSRLDSISKHQYVCPYEMATAHAVLGDKDKAFVWLRKGLQERSSCMSDVKVDPRLESLRSDPRFDEVLKAVGFQPD